VRLPAAGLERVGDLKVGGEAAYLASPIPPVYIWLLIFAYVAYICLCCLYLPMLLIFAYVAYICLCCLYLPMLLIFAYIAYVASFVTGGMGEAGGGGKAPPT